MWDTFSITFLVFYSEELIGLMYEAKLLSDLSWTPFPVQPLSLSLFSCLEARLLISRLFQLQIVLSLLLHHVDLQRCLT